MWSIRSRTSWLALALTLALLAIDAATTPAAAAGAAEHRGRVTFSGLPVPGATVTASRGEVSRSTVTDEQGFYHFADLADGPWTIEVSMLGFVTERREVVVAADAPMPELALTARPFEEIAAGHAVVNTATPTPSTPAANANGFARVGVTASAGSTPTAGTPAASQSQPQSAAPAPAQPVDAGGSDRSAEAADGFLINGSVNNGAASPFAQLAAFGNNRRGPRSLFNGGLGVIFGSSALDARPYSFTDAPAAKPSYSDVQVVGSFAGPVKIPGLRNKANTFVGFQHTANHDATTQSALMPTEAERHGDFSQSVDAFGQPVRLIDPSTGQPFAGNVIPAARIAPQAASLLNFYPLPNVDAAGQTNFQVPVITRTVQDALQVRYIETLNNKNALFGSVSVQRTQTDSGNVFGFVDTTSVSGADLPVTWSHRFSQFLTLRLRYQFTTLDTHTTPYFANRQNVSGDAGIAGNDQDALNWGPPNLSFSDGTAGLASAQYASNHDRTHSGGGEIQWAHGRHNVIAGGDLRDRSLDIVSQQNARGSFTFTGATTGSPFADFLLGIPHASAIAFGNATQNLHAPAADAYITDDWRIGPTFTANVGVRWELEAPFTEDHGRLANLDIAPGFTAVAPVTADNPIGPLTGRRYPSSLLRTDFAGIQPRIGIAWRPVPGSSLVVRGGYGIYRNSSIYQTIDFLLAQQPPLAKASSVENSPSTPLTLANGFIAAPGVASNTFAVDPDLRVGYAHSWQVLVQRDLPASLTMTATYLGSLGRNLFQEFLPNTYPIGAVNPCPACPAGFVYLTSNGSSTRNAGQFQLRRRLRNGLTASVQYTLAKATDDAAAYNGASLSGAVIAQDWQHLEAERAPSAFDQRHQVTATVQYTSGVGVTGGALADDFRGSLLKGWTVTGQLTTGSGLPVTPVYLTNVPGTGVVGTIRPDLTGAAVDAGAGSGFYANPAAFAMPAAGRWGTAGRNSIRGPAQFSLNAGVGRSFLLSDRLTLDWRLDATNVLNTVTYSNISTILGSPQFGLPIQANVMRKLQSTLRVRF